MIIPHHSTFLSHKAKQYSVRLSSHFFIPSAEVGFSALCECLSPNNCECLSPNNIVLDDHPTFLSPVEGGFSALFDLSPNNIVLDDHPKSSHFFLSPDKGGFSALCELRPNNIVFEYHPTLLSLVEGGFSTLCELSIKAKQYSVR